jgi:hypothetical protein
VLDAIFDRISADPRNVVLRLLRSPDLRVIRLLEVASWGFISARFWPERPLWESQVVIRTKLIMPLS